MPTIEMLVYLQTARFTRRMGGVYEIYGLETSFELGQRRQKYLWIDEYLPRAA